MGQSVIYYGEHDGARTVRALELGPDDLDWGVVSPEAPEAEQAEALADAVAVITNGLDNHRDARKNAQNETASSDGRRFRQARRPCNS
jgi:hypothetical protein